MFTAGNPFLEAFATGIANQPPPGEGSYNFTVRVIPFCIKQHHLISFAFLTLHECPTECKNDVISIIYQSTTKPKAEGKVYTIPITYTTTITDIQHSVVVLPISSLFGDIGQQCSKEPFKVYILIQRKPAQTKSKCTSHVKDCTLLFSIFRLIRSGLFNLGCSEEAEIIPGFVQFSIEGICYFIPESQQHNVTWKEAEQQCHNNNGTLAKITGISTLESIKSKLTVYPFRGKLPVFFGLCLKVHNTFNMDFLKVLFTICSLLEKLKACHNAYLVSALDI